MVEALRRSSIKRVVTRTEQAAAFMPATQPSSLADCLSREQARVQVVDIVSTMTPLTKMPPDPCPAGATHHRGLNVVCPILQRSFAVRVLGELLARITLLDVSTLISDSVHARS